MTWLAWPAPQVTAHCRTREWMLSIIDKVLYSAGNLFRDRGGRSSS